MSELSNNVKKAIQVCKTEGFTSVFKHVKHYINTKNEAKISGDSTKDILFINGCAKDLLPHPYRYRVLNQMEQLQSNGYTCDEVFFKNINNDLVYKYRAFIIFRATYTPELDSFIQLAKQFNKTVFYDIDDLVFDTKYTDSIAYVAQMKEEIRERYDSDVMKNGKLLSMCDVAITTTEKLAEELKKYVPNVIINRNRASLELVSLSNKVIKENNDFINIGYFSGSITHNPDFEMILPVVCKLLKKYPNLKFHLCGEIDVPEELEEYKNQISIHPFMDWKELPSLIGQMDINLAPIQKSIFNEAKSEIKWMEASLVKVPTVASNFGAFKVSIKNQETGILCSTLKDWELELSQLIENENKRKYIANNAYKECIKNYVTLYSGMELISNIEKYIPKNIAFCVSKIEISGGIMIALRHAAVLQDTGYDVSFLSLLDDIKSYTYNDHTFPVLSIDNKNLHHSIDLAVATFWDTVPMMEKILNIKQRCYLVQNFETDFYNFDDPHKVRANNTYCPKTNIKFITISKWCQSWLENKYNQRCSFIPNGIDINDFYSADRNWKGKIRILIEGDCSAEHKNVDESFKITNELDPSKYEVWYMSYNANPKEWYRIDKFLHRIPYSEVADTYRQCNILIKTSLLESFSYPPLEMMATGGCVVALANEGNVEYLKDKYNCLFYSNGNIEQGKKCIEQIVLDENLRNNLIKNGITTAKERDWEEINKKIVEIYTTIIDDFLLN